MYGIKVLFDEERKDWIWLRDSKSSMRTGNDFVLKFATYEEAKAYACSIKTMSAKVEKVD